MKNVGVVALAVLVSASAASCVDDAPELDALDDSFVVDGKADGAADARKVLAMANRATHAQFVEMGLANQTIRSIETARAGADRRFGTADDVTLPSVEALDALPYVGTIAFGKLLAYASRSSEAHAYVPRGTVDIQTLITLDVVTETAGGDSIGDPLQAPGADDNEQLLCHLKGENPGVISITCRRDEAGGQMRVVATGAMPRNGKFEVTGTYGALPVYDQYLRVGGKFENGKLVIDDYEFVRVQRCPPFGACDLERIHLVLRHVKLPGAQSGPIGQDCASDNGPVITTVSAAAGFTIEQQCGTCYQRKNVCVTGISDSAELTCLHNRIEHPVTSTAGCPAHLTTLGSYQCNSAPRNYICEGAENTNPVADDAATLLAASCPAGFRAVGTCDSQKVCLDARVPNYVVTNGIRRCPAGMHVAKRYFCSFVDQAVCVDD